MNIRKCYYASPIMNNHRDFQAALYNPTVKIVPTLAICSLSKKS